LNRYGVVKLLLPHGYSSFYERKIPYYINKNLKPMKSLKTLVLGVVAAGMLLTGCSSMSNTGKGALIGTGSGGALGAAVGALIGGGKGAAIGAAVGAGVGAGAGALIGNKMDKAAKQAAEVAGAQVETTTDDNGLEAVKVTFDSGILFNTGKSTLSTSAQSSLSQFANNVLKQNTDMDVAIYGYSDNTGWKNCTTEQSTQKNLELSQQRAQSVSSYLLNCGVGSSQIQTVQGYGESYPVASNDTAAGREQNRRVEVYLYASKAMIEAANNGTLQ
jgi:outer membrane protein OmpA-like peptidoglycan-associated protein